MKLDDAIRGRRSVRVYKDKKVSDKVLSELLDAGVQAPSACNFQKWRFISVESPKLRNKMIELSAAPFIKNAPVVLLVLYSNKTINLGHYDHIQSAAAAIQNINLKAYSLGLGTCWVCHIPPKKNLRKLFSIPKSYDPIACVTIGYPKQKPKSMHRKKPELAKNRFIWTDDGRVPLHMRIGLKIYYLFPLWLKKRVNRIVDKKYVRKFRN